MSEFRRKDCIEHVYQPLTRTSIVCKAPSLCAPMNRPDETKCERI